MQIPVERWPMRDGTTTAVPALFAALLIASAIGVSAQPLESHREAAKAAAQVIDDVTNARYAAAAERMAGIGMFIRRHTKPAFPDVAMVQSYQEPAPILQGLGEMRDALTRRDYTRAFTLHVALGMGIVGLDHKRPAAERVQGMKARYGGRRRRQGSVCAAGPGRRRVADGRARGSGASRPATAGSAAWLASAPTAARLGAHRPYSSRPGGGGARRPGWRGRASARFVGRGHRCFAHHAATEPHVGGSLAGCGAHRTGGRLSGRSGQDPLVSSGIRAAVGRIPEPVPGRESPQFWSGRGHTPLAAAVR